jgi:hypothetical protein
LGFVLKKSLADLSSSKFVLKFVSRPRSFFWFRVNYFFVVRKVCRENVDRKVSLLASVFFSFSKCQRFFVSGKIVSEEIVASIYFVVAVSEGIVNEVLCSKSSGEKPNVHVCVLSTESFLHQRRPVHGARPIAHNVCVCAVVGF